jgi:hypothetical protein
MSYNFKKMEAPTVELPKVVQYLTMKNDQKAYNEASINDSE